MITVGIYGGTFDVWHQGHEAILQDMVGKVDVLYVIPTSITYYKKNKILHTFEERYNDLVKRTMHIPNVIVSDIERNKDEHWGFVDTLKLIARRYPKQKIKVAIGGDSFITLPTWHRYEEVVANCSLIVYNRPGYSTERFPDIEHEFVEMNIDISSSQLRKEIRGMSDEEFELMLDESWWSEAEDLLSKEDIVNAAANELEEAK